MVAMGVAMLKYSYQCVAGFLNLNVNQGIITAKSFQNTINDWSGMVNLHVPKNVFLGEKFKCQSIRSLARSWIFLKKRSLSFVQKKHIFCILLLLLIQ